MEKEKRITTTYKDDDIIVIIENTYYMSTYVHILGETKSLSLTRQQALKLLTILSTANEEAEI